MTLLITSDLHLSANPRDGYRHAFMEKLPNVAVQQKVRTTVILGDLTELKDNHPAELVNATVDHLAALAKVCFVVIVPGNHDWLSSANNPFFAFLRHIPKIKWVDRPTALADVIRYEGTLRGEDLPNVLLLPHASNPEKAWKDIDFSIYDWAFCHQSFAGAVTETGHKLSGIPLSLIPKPVKIISGDIHTPQEVGGRLTYVGSPFTIDFGDGFQPRMLLLRSNNNSLVSIPCGGSQKILIEATSFKAFEGLKKFPGVEPGDILKVRIPLTSTEHAELPKITAQIRAWGEKLGYVIHMVQPVLAKPGARMTKVKAAPIKADPDVLKSYAKARDLSDSTTKTGLKLLEG